MKDHIFELRRKILRHDWSSQWHTQQINKFKKMNEWMPEKKKKQFRPERDSNPAHDLCDTDAVF